jgi:hypothetical protein
MASLAASHEKFGQQARVAAVLGLLALASACSSMAGPGQAEGTQGEGGSSGPGPARDAGSKPTGSADSGSSGAGDAGQGTGDAGTTVVASDSGAMVDVGQAPVDAGVDAPAVDASADAAADAVSFNGAWAPVSYGVSQMDTGGGNNIAIAYGGYTATAADSQAWVTEMTATRLTQLGVGHMVAVQGPEDAEYAAREIGNSELAAALLTEAASATYIIVIAHSSGGFVADELFTFVDPTVMAKIAYFNLDGGSWALTNAMVDTMRGVYFCGAHDSVAGYSENYSSDESLSSTFTQSRLFTVDADGSGCNVGAGWCLHDTLIINHPHDPADFDLALDYTDFTGGRQVVTSYIDQGVSDGVL